MHEHTPEQRQALFNELWAMVRHSSKNISFCSRLLKDGMTNI
jgi:hypothetical protein